MYILREISMCMLDNCDIPPPLCESTYYGKPKQSCIKEAAFEEGNQSDLKPTTQIFTWMYLL